MPGVTVEVRLNNCRILQRPRESRKLEPVLENLQTEQIREHAKSETAVGNLGLRNCWLCTDTQKEATSGFVSPEM